MEKTMHADEYSRIVLKDGIVFGDFLSSDLDYESAIQIVKKRKEICNGKSRPILVDLTIVKNVSKEARDYFGSDEGLRLLKASAMIVDSPLSSFVAHFFVNVNVANSSIPFRVFHKNDREIAISWLKSFL